MPQSPVTTIGALVQRIPDGALLAVPADYAGVAMTATRALLHRGVKDLHFVCLPSGGVQTDLLIGAGAIRTIETAAVTLGEFGAAPRFVEAVRRGAIGLKDATCPAIHAAFQAAEKGIPFIPLRGVLGSDLVSHRDDWKVIDNPFAADDPILLVPAIKPDFVLFHATKADRFGNVWIGRHRELMTLAHAARETLVTAEEIVEENLLADEVLAAGVIPSLYVSAVAEAKRGAWPLALPGVYTMDETALRTYAEAAQTEAGFHRILGQWLRETEVAAA